MAVEAGSRWIKLLPLRKSLVLKHVSVASPLAIVLGKRIACPHDLQSWIEFQLGTRHDRTRIRLRRRMGHRFASTVFGALHVDSAKIKIVLQRKILSPDGRIRDRVVQLHHAIEGVASLLLSLKDVDQQSRYRESRDGCQNNGDGCKSARAPFFLTIPVIVCHSPTCSRLMGLG